MILGIIGRKLGMVRVFAADGGAEACSLVAAGPCYVTQVKNPPRDGYIAAQIGFEESGGLNRPQKGHLKSLPPLRHLREVPVDSIEGIRVGERVEAGWLKPGALVDVTGISKGRGFAGVVKRHGFRGGPKTHGQSDRHRAPGSIGSGTTPGRVYKGMRMAGRMGGKRVTVRNIKVFHVDQERSVVALAGAVPGPRGGLLLLRTSTAVGKEP